jgi:hypothetical protein
MGVFLFTEDPPKENPSTTIVNNYHQSTQQQPQQAPVISTNNNNYEIAFVIMSLWSIPTMILCCIESSRIHGACSIYGFILGLLLKMSFK